MAGRAMGYSDYYKNNSTTVDDNEEENTVTTPVRPGSRVTNKDDARKLAIRKRLAKLRKAGN